MATEPSDMKALVDACHNVYKAMGNKERVLIQGEEEQRLKMRRSLITKVDIKSGEILRVEDICAKRPGDGISPMEFEGIIGKKVIKDIPKGHLIRWEYVD